METLMSAYLAGAARQLQPHGVAADDALLLHAADAAARGRAGERDLLCNVLDRHTGVLGEKGEDLLSSLSKKFTSLMSIVWNVKNLALIKPEACGKDTKQKEKAFQGECFNYIKLKWKSKE